MSATPDRTFSNPEQWIADLERQLAEREAELAEARERETATAEVLGVINASPGDLAPVFNAMPQKATTLCEAPFGIMQTYDGKRFVPAASYDVPAPLAAFLAHDPSQPGPETGLGRIARGRCAFARQVSATSLPMTAKGCFQLPTAAIRPSLPGSVNKVGSSPSPAPTTDEL